MKNSIIIIVLIASAFFVSCKEEPSKPLQEIGNAVVLDPLKTSKTVENIANIEEIRRTINEYYNLNGKYPADISVIEAQMTKKFDSSKYDYNGQTGEIRPR